MTKYKITYKNNYMKDYIVTEDWRALLIAYRFADGMGTDVKNIYNEETGEEIYEKYLKLFKNRD